MHTLCAHMNNKPDVIVVGCGAFGIASALELLRRGYQVTVIDPNVAAASRFSSSDDISKILRGD